MIPFIVAFPFHRFVPVIYLNDSSYLYAPDRTKIAETAVPLLPRFCLLHTPAPTHVTKTNILAAFRF